MCGCGVFGGRDVGYLDILGLRLLDFLDFRTFEDVSDYFEDSWV